MNEIELVVHLDYGDRPCHLIAVWREVVLDICLLDLSKLRKSLYLVLFLVEVILLSPIV